MSDKQTVVFTDLHGSTAVFESLGNSRATEVVTGFNRAIAQLVEKHNGQVIKTLGDGILAIFDSAQNAVDACVVIQRQHHLGLEDLPRAHRMPVRIGISTGSVEWVQGDCYGDAVNVASRLCDLCGPGQIWANETSISRSTENNGASFRPLGPISVRGRTEPCYVFQIEWQPDASMTDVMTVLGNFDPNLWSGATDALGKEIRLEFGAQIACFHSFDLPVSIGRVRSNGFVVADPRVSRMHAQLTWKNGAVFLDDLSSYGTWIRFDGLVAADTLLRRSSCALHGNGLLALGASFAEANAPIVRFSVV